MIGFGGINMHLQYPQPYTILIFMRSSIEYHLPGENNSLNESSCLEELVSDFQSKILWTTKKKVYTY